ncbi:MAG: FAD-binding oxidoreductase [Maritimibacter sp.]
MIEPQKTRWRHFNVLGKQAESEIITSFYFAPGDGEPLAPFIPGQFLTFRFQKPDGSEEVLRNYSLSALSEHTRCYRISVKREPAPVGSDVPPGYASNYLHDMVQVGDRLLIEEPRGRFFLDEASTRPVLLLSGGVGAAPLVAMAHRLAEQGTRKTWFMHACDNGRVHAFKDEIDDLVECRENFHRYYCYRAPDEIDRENNAFDAEGLLDLDKMRSFLPIDQYECYLCGPPAFMQAVFSLLIDLGVPEEQIRYEFFGPSTVLKTPQPQS